MLFGRRKCEENNEWEVRIHFEDSSVTLAEQLTEEEAKEFYEKLKKEVDKKAWIEVKSTSNEENALDTRYIQTSNIKLIKLTCTHE